MRNLLFTLCVLAMCLSGCKRQKENTNEPRPLSELQPITLGMMSSMDGFPFIVAQEQGIYDSLGLPLQIIQFNSPNDRDAAFTARQLDGAITDIPSTLLLQKKCPGVSLVMKTDGYFCFIATRRSKINRMTQLKGKNMAVSRGTVIEYATDLLCQKVGLTSNEINQPEIGQISLRLSMLQYNQIEASFLPDPYATMAMNSGDKSLITTQELGIHLTGVAFSEKALNEKRPEIATLIEGYNLGVTFILTHPQREVTALLIKATGIPESLAGLIVLPSYTHAMRPAEQDINHSLQWLKKKGWILPTQQTDHLVDTTFAVPNKKR